MLGYGTNEHGYCVFNKTTSLIEITVDITFDETNGSQKEQVNVEVVSNEEAPHKAIKMLAIGEIKPIENDDEENIMHIDHDPTIHHVSSNEHGESSASRDDQDGAQGHSHEDGSNNVQAQPQLNLEFRSEDNPSQLHGYDSPIDHDHDDEEDDGPIQRSTHLPHPRVHQPIQQDHPIDNILGSIRCGVTMCSCLASFCEYYSFISPLEPRRVEEALDDED
jgi:hypothetical protein